MASALEGRHVYSLSFLFCSSSFWGEIALTPPAIVAQPSQLPKHRWVNAPSYKHLAPVERKQ